MDDEKLRALAEGKAKIEDLRLLRWSPKFHKTLSNPTAPGGKVDMWEMTDDRTGATLVSVGVPPGRADIAGYIAACCGSPVRWVTNMRHWRDDPRADGVDDPERTMDAEAAEIADVLFGALSEWMVKTGREQANGWTLSDALATIWFTFCGQLSHEMRGQLLFKFLRLATTDIGDDVSLDAGTRPPPQA